MAPGQPDLWSHRSSRARCEMQLPFRTSQIGANDVGGYVLCHVQCGQPCEATGLEKAVARMHADYPRHQPPSHRAVPCGRARPCGCTRASLLLKLPLCMHEFVDYTKSHGRIGFRYRGRNAGADTRHLSPCANGDLPYRATLRRLASRSLEYMRTTKTNKHCKVYVL